ncbi:hypothetical protein DL764_007022 [Monosporascus ibericus]|uniref:Uncharacterized protein n=1 Tax=Monosporascus ibericus TaxID=155417 RepID=A0A4Q4T5G2_9PEZI|nr:hypothetical protein DL764_007022 [Monosporascus ibericus]
MDSAEAEVLEIRNAHLFGAATTLLKTLFELRSSKPNGELPQAEIDETYDKITWLPLVYDPQYEKHEVLRATFANICEAALNVDGGPRTDVLLNIMRMIWVVGTPRPSGSQPSLGAQDFIKMYGVTMTKDRARQQLFIAIDRVWNETIEDVSDDESIATLISGDTFAQEYREFQFFCMELYRTGILDHPDMELPFHALLVGPEWPMEMDDRNRPEPRSCAIEWVIAAPMEFFTLSLGVPCNNAIDEGVRFGKRWRHSQPALEGELEKELPIFKIRQECPVWARMRYANLMAFIQDPPDSLAECAAKAKGQIDKVKESWALISQSVSAALSSLDQHGDESTQARSATQSFARVFWEQVEQCEKPGVDEEGERNMELCIVITYLTQ